MTSKVKKIIAAIEGLDEAERAEVLRTLRGKSVKILTNGRGAVYNARMVNVLAPKRKGNNFREKPAPGFGRRIAEKRKAADLTLQELSARADVHYVTISRYEGEKLTPGDRALKALTEGLDNTTFDYLKFGF